VTADESTAAAAQAQARTEAQDSLTAAFGGRSGLLDTGLPGVVFVIAYVASSHDMQLSVILAVVAGVVLAILRIARHEKLQNAIAGLVGVGVAAYVASKTGEARNYFLPGLLINIGYGAAYAISNLVRWPLIGVLVATVQAHGTAWRKNPAIMRAYTRATWLWVAMFAVRLLVQVPLYLAGDGALVALGVARVAMGWPLFLLTVWLTYLTVRNAPSTKPPDQESVTDGAAVATVADPEQSPD
jgi:hypothetical protein